MNEIIKSTAQFLFEFLRLRKKSKNTVIQLKSHDIFNTCHRVRKQMDFYKFYTYGSFDGVKTKMCLDFTHAKIDECTKGFVKIIERENIETMTSDELKKYLLNEMALMHGNYIRDIKSKWLNKNIPLDDVNYVIELFEKFRYDVIVSFEYRINAIFGSSFHENNFERVLAVFEMWSIGIDLLPKDMQTTFEALNGKFKEINYV
jgi:hypothetical protein